jgi:hypothetical protein
MRENISQDAVDTLTKRYFVEAATIEDKMFAVFKWALSYKCQKLVINKTHLEAVAFDEGLKEIWTSSDTLHKD